MFVRLKGLFERRLGSSGGNLFLAGQNALGETKRAIYKRTHSRKERQGAPEKNLGERFQIDVTVSAMNARCAAQKFRR
jgi:hypothetical protein